MKKHLSIFLYQAQNLQSLLFLFIYLLVTGLIAGIDLTGKTCLKGLKKLHEFTVMPGTF